MKGFRPFKSITKQKDFLSSQQSCELHYKTFQILNCVTKCLKKALIFPKFFKSSGC